MTTKRRAKQEHRMARKPKFRVGQIVALVEDGEVIGKVTFVTPAGTHYNVRHCPFNSRGDITVWREKELRRLTKREAGQ